MEKPIRVHLSSPKCEYDGTPMENTDRGTRCPTCGHEVVDEDFDPFGSMEEAASAPEPCRCVHCAGKA